MVKRFLTVLLLCTCAQARAEVDSQLEFQVYHAQAQRGKPLSRSLTEASPIHEQGHTFLGHTSRDERWNMRWNDTPDGRCRLTEYHVTLRVTILLPQLDGIDPDRQAEYTRFYTALRIHEDGHYRIALKMAEQLDHMLETLPPKSNCRELEQTANELGRNIVDDAREHDRDYDARTEHGKTQGAYLSN